MLQRLSLVSALMASAALLTSATELRITHFKAAHERATTATGTGSGSAAATTPTTATTASTAGSSSSSGWHMQPVVSVQARVDGSPPVWDETTETWVSPYGDNYDEQYNGVLDTVNTASVEGALMYVQAEGINQNEQSVKCERKNGMAYVIFYEMTVVQPTPSIAYYGSKHTPEYCEFVAMDGGLCTKAGSDIPDTCKQFDGLDGQPDLGHCVGANLQTTDPRAPYPGNYWFSFPNSCVTKAWADKTEECRTKYPGGLCAPGTAPDGETCSFSYKIMGYLALDDLVGITDGSAVGTKYGNFTEFCEAGNVEFDAKNTGKGFDVSESIPFWEDPSDEKANANRSEAMVTMYNKLAPSAKEGKMTALPEMSDLIASNPPCYENSPECAAAANGCKRTLYAQICEVCEAASEDCIVAPSDFTFPDLPVPVGESSGSSEGSNQGSSVGSGSSAAMGAQTLASAAVLAVGAVAATML